MSTATSPIVAIVVVVVLGAFPGLSDGACKCPRGSSPQVFPVTVENASPLFQRKILAVMTARHKSAPHVMGALKLNFRTSEFNSYRLDSQDVCFEAVLRNAEFAEGQGVNMVMVGTTTTNQLINTVCSCSEAAGGNFCSQVLPQSVRARLNEIKAAIEGGKI